MELGGGSGQPPRADLWDPGHGEGGHGGFGLVLQFTGGPGCCVVQGGVLGLSWVGAGNPFGNGNEGEGEGSV